MPTSKCRIKRSSRVCQRERDRQEAMNRGTYRARLVAEAIHGAVEAHGTRELTEALERLGKVTHNKAWTTLEFEYSTPTDWLAGRPGWKSLGYSNTDFGERWIYSPTIPASWDENSIDSPTTVIWDDFTYEVRSAVGPEHSAPRSMSYDNPLRFFRDLPMIERW